MTPNPPPAAPRDPDALRVAVHGLGREGLALTATLAMRPECELVALGDPRPAAIRRARGAGFALPGFARLERLIAAAAPQALVIAVPAPERAAAVRRALEAGVAVLTTSPLAATLVEAETLAALAEERGVALAVAHQLPFEPPFAHAERELGVGALGVLKLARSSVYESRVFSTREARAQAAHSPGGVLTATALDLLLMLDTLFGTPTTVRATTSSLYGAHEDEAHAMMTLATGAEIGLDASWSVPGYPRPAVVLEAEGDNGAVLVSDDAYEVELTTRRDPLPAGHRRLRDAELEQSAWYDMDGEARDPMVAAFVAWALGGAVPPHAAATSVRAQRTLESLYASARRGGTDVRVGAP